MACSLAAEMTADTGATLLPPPGLEAPPGLELPEDEESVAPPPGLENIGAPMYVASKLCPPAPGVTVCLSNLPNHILSDAMMNVTLEQAQLDQFVLHLTTMPGAQRGDAMITFPTVDVAMRCVGHFHGRRWDASGTLVSAWLLPVQAPPKPRQMPTARKSCAKSKPSFTLSAEAAEFVPGAFQMPTSGKETPTIGSDVSTEDGESAASSDEKEVAA